MSFVYPFRRPTVNLVRARRLGRFRTCRLTALAACILAAAIGPTSALAAPANDDFADAQSLDSTAEGSVDGSNVGATKETGEPNHAGNAGGHSVWYSWTAPADGNAFFTTGFFTDFDTLLAVYTGVAVDALTPIAANDDAAFGRSTVSFPVSSGVTYMVAIDGFSGKIGTFGLTWGPAPANDNFADAVSLPGASSGMASGNVRGATLEPGESPFLFSGGTVWYSWTAPADGTYKFNTAGSRFDTDLAVFTGASLGSLTTVGVNDDDPDRGCCSSWVPIRNATAGTTYRIAVSALDDFCRNCDLVLNWSPLILGGAGDETLVGTAGDEEIRGRGGNDILRGGGGNDNVFGGRGNDREYGGVGNDLVLDRQGRDQLFGRSGSDRLDARDFFRPGGADALVGGLGVDTCLGNRNDSRRGCP
jgi:Ca2+-binding RTX toxin-like protein